MYKKITTLVFACSCLLNAWAQFDLQNTQKFNWPKANRPYIGFDCLRTFNPEIILQTRTGYNAIDLTYTWQHLYKFNTIYAGFNTNIFSELGVYDFDTFIGKWKDNWVENYNIDYNFVKKRVNQFTLQRGAANPAQNKTYRTRYVFDSLHKVILEYNEVLQNSQYDLLTTTYFIYDTLSTVIRTDKVYQTGFYIETYYSYDRQNRLTGELSLSKFQANPMDSSVRRTYVYDSIGRVISSRTEIYKIKDSPYKWTTSQNITYDYDLAGNMVSNAVWTYDYTQNYKQVPLLSYTYDYTSTGKINNYAQVDFVNGMVADKMIFTIRYDANDNAEEALAYTWNGAGFNLLPSYRFLFSQDATSDIKGIATHKPVVIYPNPCKDKLTILNMPVENISILDLNSKEVLNANNSNEIDVSELAPGIYYIKTGDQKAIKFIKT